MQTGQILHNGTPWVARVEVAATLFDRMRGLIGRPSLPAGHGLLIEACGSIHTLGMRFPIDVIFLDRAWQVRRVVRQVRPGRLMIRGGWHGLRALEVASGWLDLDGVAAGTQLVWQPTTGSPGDVPPVPPVA